MTTQQVKPLPQAEIDMQEATDLIVSSLVVVTIMRDLPLTEYEKEVIKSILLTYKGTPDFKVKTLVIELERLYTKGDKELESLVTTYNSLFA